MKSLCFHFLAAAGKILVAALIGAAMAGMAYIALEQDNREIETGKMPWSGYNPDLPEIHYNH